MGLQLFGNLLQLRPGGGNRYTGLLEYILAVVDVLITGGHGDAQDLIVNGIAGSQGVIPGGLGAGQIQQIVLEAGEGEGLVEHHVGQLIGRSAHLHGVPVLGVVLDLFHFDVGLGILFLKLPTMSFSSM